MSEHPIGRDVGESPAVVTPTGLLILGNADTSATPCRCGGDHFSDEHEDEHEDEATGQSSDTP